MDILKEFEEFLPKWCHENHLPKPPIGKQNKVWRKGWQAFMDTYLKEHYDEIREEFLNIKVLTRKELERQLKEEKENKLKQKQEVEEEETSWERVQQLLKET